MLPSFAQQKYLPFSPLQFICDLWGWRRRFAGGMSLFRPKAKRAALRPRVAEFVIEEL
jgi:hypothetical protein